MCIADSVYIRDNKEKAGLVLTRKIGQKIKIGDDIIIELAQIQGKAARLRIQAPMNIKIMRTELEEGVK